MPTLIEVYEPGSKVYVGHDPGDIRGEVLEFMVSGADLAVSYHVAWWEGRTRRKEWLEACEVRQAPESRQMNVGFKALAAVSPASATLLERSVRALGACDDVDDRKLKRGILLLALQALKPLRAAALEADMVTHPGDRRVASIAGQLTYGDLRAIKNVLELADGK